MYKNFVVRLGRGTPGLARGPRAISTRFQSSAAAPTFNWQDPLSSKTLLTEEELAISETAERYCQEQLAPRVLRTLHPPQFVDHMAQNRD